MSVEAIEFQLKSPSKDLIAAIGKHLAAIEASLRGDAKSSCVAHHVAEIDALHDMLCGKSAQFVRCRIVAADADAGGPTVEELQRFVSASPQARREALGVIARARG